MTPVFWLALVTAAYLGGQGAWTAVFGGALPVRGLGAAEALAGLLLAWPRTRRAGAMAMIGVLAVAFGHHLLLGQTAWPLAYDAAVCLFLASGARAVPVPRREI